MGVKNKTIGYNQRVSALDSHVFGLEALRKNVNNPSERPLSEDSQIAEEEIFRSMRYPTKVRVSLKVFHKSRNISVVVLLSAVILMAVVIGITLYYKIYPGRDSPSPNTFPMSPPLGYSIRINHTGGMYSIRTIKFRGICHCKLYLIHYNNMQIDTYLTCGIIF